MSEVINGTFMFAGQTFNYGATAQEIADATDLVVTKDGVTAVPRHDS